MEKGILVKYRAGLSRLIDCEEEWLEFTPGDTLVSILSDNFRLRSISKNKVVDIKNFLMTLNGAFIPASESGKIMLKEGDVISLFPTVSGG